MKHRLAESLIRAIQRVPPERRRVWAAELFILSCVGWLVTQVALAIWPDSPVFQHTVMAISWGAILATAIDVMLTSDVRAETEKAGGTD